MSRKSNRYLDHHRNGDPPRIQLPPQAAGPQIVPVEFRHQPGPLASPAVGVIGGPQGVNVIAYGGLDKMEHAAIELAKSMVPSMVPPHATEVGNDDEKRAEYSRWREKIATEAVALAEAVFAAVQKRREEEQQKFQEAQAAASDSPANNDEPKGVIELP